MTFYWAPDTKGSISTKSGSYVFGELFHALSLTIVSIFSLFFVVIKIDTSLNKWMFEECKSGGNQMRAEKRYILLWDHPQAVEIGLINLGQMRKSNVLIDFNFGRYCLFEKCYLPRNQSITLCNWYDIGNIQNCCWGRFSKQLDLFWKG